MASMDTNKENVPKRSREFFVIDSAGIRSKLSYAALLDHFQASLPSATELVRCPHRQQFSIDSSSTLLLMPSWPSTSVFPYLGVKIVTSFPQNSARNLPGINASYLLFDSAIGRPLSCIDGTEMTLWRTSCVSALAARKLAREDAGVLVMVGAGALATHLIRAHLTVRPSLKKVFIWNRTAEKAISLVKKLQEEVNGVQFVHGASLGDIIGEGDVVSCATSSEVPVVEGQKLKNGVHLDLVGSFTPSMKECDDEAIARGRVFVDCEAAFAEAGELVGAFDRGVISPGDVVATLPELIKGEKIGRSCSDQITVFKSVGSAVVDLLAAQLIYESHL
ncbi:protein SAR DEFICIENT 4 [Nymphaea colorata]|uniref:Ornithine cyclodeaminase n=1 Tax=Nymphaea colorata TaxID=210225 RepID=A0A5K1AV43_9MAGN|nr:protein SAR DEFICIENT 4 [Nymphaea colorata]